MATAFPRNHVEVMAEAVAAATGGVVLRGRDKRARGVVSDTRTMAGGEAFVALRGAQHDGHVFLGEAAACGAELLVVEGEGSVPDGPDIVCVSDTLTAWGDLARAHARAWRSARSDRRMVAITGSAGKTTTKQLCAALLAEVAETHATPGNLNNLVGVPAVLFALEARHRFAVVECGMSVRGEIAALASIASADVSIITNVSVAHAEGVGGTREDVAREKGALFDALGEDGVCVYDADDTIGRSLAARCKATRKVGFGRTSDAAYRLVDRVSLGLAGSRVTLERPGANAIESLELRLPFVGEAAAIDLCAALAAADAAAGVLPRDAIVRALGGVQNVAGRVALHETDAGILVIDDSYNANPASMRAALSVLVDLGQERRRVAVLGEMKELGACASDEHRALGDAIAAAGVALVVGCGGLATHVVARARALGVDAVDCESVDEAIPVALERTRRGDVVLVKGSRSTGTERVVLALKNRGAR